VIWSRPTAGCCEPSRTIISTSTGGCFEQADGTAWMALDCQNMLEIALELSPRDSGCEDLAGKFSERFISENTRFWVVRARVSARAIYGLGTVFSGAYLDIDPGKPGKPSRSFQGSRSLLS
jgi:hypothetical protein